MNMDLAANKIHPVKKYLLYMLPFAAMIFLAACNPEEQASIVNEEQDPIGGEDTPGDIPIENPSEPNTEYTADIFFVQQNRLIGVRDAFFAVDHEGVGTIPPPFLSVNLPPSSIGANASTPFVFRTNTEELTDYSNLRMATVAGNGTVAVYEPNATDNQNWVEVWSNQLSGELSASPSIYGNGLSRTLIYVDFNGTVHALDANTGNENWTYTNPQNSPFVAHPLVIQELNLVIVASFGGWVYGLNAQSGNLVWSYNTGELVFAKPYFHENSSDAIASVVVVTQLGRCFQV